MTGIFNLIPAKQKIIHVWYFDIIFRYLERLGQNPSPTYKILAQKLAFLLLLFDVHKRDTSCMFDTEEYPF